MAILELPVSAPAQVYRSIREKIIGVQLQPGAPLGEQKLAAEFGVSRTPIREGLLKLAAEGLVEIIHNRGAVVAPIRVEAVKTAQFVRESLEISVAIEAAKKIDALGELSLRQAIEEQRVASHHAEVERFYQSDERLHRAISEVAGLPLVWTHIEEAKVQMDRVRRLNLMSISSFDELIAHHERIVNAICNDKIEEIRESLHDHLGKILPDLEVLRCERPEFFAV